MTSAKFVRQLSRFGLGVERRGKHLAVRCPNGQFVIVPATPSDHRAVKNTAAELRRNGAAIHWKHLT